MAANVSGADIDALNNLRLTLERQAAALQRVVNMASVATSSLERLWHGPDSARFTQQWRSVHRPRLTRAVAELQAAADAVERNRQAQEQTSAAAAGAAIGAGGGTRPIPFVGEGNGGQETLGPPAPKPTPEEILEQYQVEDDEIVDWKPKLGGLPWVRAFWQDSIQLTQKEAELLDGLATREGINGLNRFKGIRDAAFEESVDRYPPTTREFDGIEITANFDHTDAYRHTYWSARLAAEFGPEWALAFTEAHEGVPGNPADMEAMDLHNNELGIRIAQENPDASPEELADLVFEAVENGEAVVIDGNNELAYSDEVPVGQTGVADDADLPGQPPAEFES